MRRTTIFRSNRMAIAVVGALMAPTFAFGQHLTVTAVTAPSTPIQAQTTAAAPTIRPGEFYAAPYVERAGGPANAGFIAGTGEVPGVPLTITERPLQSHERVFVVVPPGMSSAAGTRYLSRSLKAAVLGSGHSCAHISAKSWDGPSLLRPNNTKGFHDSFIHTMFSNSAPRRAGGISCAANI